MVTVYTSRVGSHDFDALDITIKSASTLEGKVLAPTWAMVMAHKAGAVNDEQYTEDYYTLMRHRWQGQSFRFLRVLNRERIVLCCYCGKGKFCHRYLAVDILEKIAARYAIPFERGGEL